MRPWAFSLSLVFLLNACASSQTFQPPTYYVGYSQKGVASWYGPGFHGRKTANGEIYDMHLSTAAHRTLPMGSQVEVRSLTTGKKVLVRINDRGPFVKGRIIDLSFGAARQLEMVGKGTDRVKITLVSLGEDDRKSTPLWVQAGSFSTHKGAEQLARDLNSYKKHRIRVVSVNLEDGKWYRVQIGPFSSDKEAKAVAGRIGNEWGLKPVLVRE